MADNFVLEIQNLTVAFRNDISETTAVKDICLKINSSEIVGIVGESGSGKSVTSMSVMGLLPKDVTNIKSGTIIFNDKNGNDFDLLKIDEKQMQKLRTNEIAMIFQEPMTSLNPVQKCGTQVMEAIRLHKNLSRKEAKEKTIDLFREVLLPRPEKIFDSYPHQISGGQKQRVMIAMAISCEPKLLIADEPTTALDVTVQKTILEILKNLQSKYGMSVIFITHDLGVIAEIANRIVVMYKGEIVEQGAVYPIFSNPQHPYTKGLIACRPPMEIRPEKLPTIHDFLDSTTEFSYKNISNNQRLIQHQQLYSKLPVLQIQEVKTYFPASKNIFGKARSFVKAVDNVSFDVYRGETLGLVGESGCGKTSLGRTLLKMVKNSGGKILYEGEDISTISGSKMIKLRRKMQIIFQDPYSSLNPRLTVGQAIMEPMEVHNIITNAKERRKRAIELLNRVSLGEEHFNRYPHEFSGGQRQRIVIARTLSMNPDFIVCDESVSALDVSVQAQVLNLLNELKHEFGFTYIFISHDLSVVRYMSDRIVVMKEGKIIEMGEADDLYNHPTQEYTKSLINAIPKLK